MSEQKTWQKWLTNHKRVQDEKIVLFLRRHWFVLFTKYLFILLLILAPFAVGWLIQGTFPSLASNELAKALITIILSIYYLYLWAASFTLFIDYYLDVWVVTTHRIIDIEQKGLFNKVVSEQSLEKVQDVSSTVKGVFPTFMDYGNVLIQSAAATNLFHFQQIPTPDAVAREINRLAKEYTLKHSSHQL